MLVKQVALQYPGQVEYVDEDFGHSALAEKFGLKQYPVILVDDVLMAQPDDLTAGFGKPGGKYEPLSSREKRDLFKSDLKKVIDLLLAGKDAEAHALGKTKMDAVVAKTLPALTFTDTTGTQIRSQDLKGEAVVVEFWATWCPPCRSTLVWLESMRKKFGKELVVLAVAFESPTPDVRKFVAEAGVGSTIVMGTANIATAFGNISSLPQVYVYDGDGKLKDMVLGAPPDAHKRIEAAITTALGG